MHAVRLASIGVLVGMAYMAPAMRASTPSADTSITITAWNSPRAGWLYVVDPVFQTEPPQSRIWLFDPDDGRVMGVINAGYNVDIALSPRGDRLYVASTKFGCERSDCDELTVIDTARGRVLRAVTMPEGRVQYKGFPETSSMAVSVDGGAVYLLKWGGLPSGETPMTLAVFDTVRQQFLPNDIDLGGCTSARLVAPRFGERLLVHCLASNELRAYRETASSPPVFESSLALPMGKRLFARHVFPDVVAAQFLPSPDSDAFRVVIGDGAIYDVDLKAQTVMPTAVAGREDERVSPFAWSPSADAKRVYVGVGPYDGEGTCDEIRAFDSATWQRVATIRTSTPFWNAVASRDGSMTYALSRDRGRILAIDNVRARELRAMPLGRTPSLALVAP